MLSESTEDLNLSFVVGTDNCDDLVKKLHGRLFPLAEAGGASSEEDDVFGPNWTELRASTSSSPGTSARRLEDDPSASKADEKVDVRTVMQLVSKKVARGQKIPAQMVLQLVQACEAHGTC
jgi:hypothetical protein